MNNKGNKTFTKKFRSALGAIQTEKTKNLNKRKKTRFFSVPKCRNQNFEPNTAYSSQSGYSFRRKERYTPINRTNSPNNSKDFRELKKEYHSFFFKKVRQRIASKRTTKTIKQIGNVKIKASALKNHYHDKIKSKSPENQLASQMMKKIAQRKNKENEKDFKKELTNLAELCKICDLFFKLISLIKKNKLRSILVFLAKFSKNKNMRVLKEKAESELLYSVVDKKVRLAVISILKKYECQALKQKVFLQKEIEADSIDEMGTFSLHSTLGPQSQQNNNSKKDFEDFVSFYLKFFEEIQSFIKKCQKLEKNCFKNLEQKLSSSPFPEIPLLLVEGCYTIAIIYLEHFSFKKAMLELLKGKFYCEKFSLYNLKTKFYLKLAECYSGMGKHKVARLNAQRSLEMAWHLEKSIEELKSYDWLSKCYYNLGQYSKAVFFQKKVFFL